MRVGITGADGFLGWHLRACLKHSGETEAVVGGKDIFESEQAMADFVKASDAIVHLAAATRGDEKEIYDTNIRLTNMLIAALEKDSKPVVFSSTIQIEKDTAYGRSKRENGEALLAWGKKSGQPVTILVIPNIYGEFARPFHNTVVATFCTQLVQGSESRVDGDVSVRLVHVQDVAERILDIVKKPQAGQIYYEGGNDITIRKLFEKLSDFHGIYQDNRLPVCTTSFETRLFNTYRSYLPDDTYPRMLDAKSDPRGSLFELASGYGQLFYSSTKPGQVRGNHWHVERFERFCVVQGEAEMNVRKLFTDEVVTYKLSGNTPVFVDTKTFFVHNLVNTGKDELLTLFWANKPFDPENPDTYQENI